MKTLLEQFRMAKEYIDKNANPYFKYSKMEEELGILPGRLRIFLSILHDVGYIEKYSKNAWRKKDLRKEVIEEISSLINERIRVLNRQKKKLKHEILKAKFDYAIEELLLLDENIRKME